MTDHVSSEKGHINIYKYGRVYCLPGGERTKDAKTAKRVANALEKLATQPKQTPKQSRYMRDLMEYRHNPNCGSLT